jgi:SAM-dependent methyltransferase
MARAPGTQGYDAEADALAVQYESITFEGTHRETLHLIPAAPRPGGTGRAADIGAGTGRDAAALARRGFAVVAVEPTAELVAHARRLHAGLAIEWLDDALPDLPVLAARGAAFDIVLLTAVWMHLDAAERVRAMTAVAPLVAPGGVMTLSLRHGPVPPGRRMFEIDPDEVAAQAEAHGLRAVHRAERRDMLGRAGVRWSLLAFARP